MFYVYILRSLKDDKLYVGYTSNLRSRLRSHNYGENISTKGRAPFELIYYEAYSARADALAREKNIKHFKQGYTNLKKRLSASLAEKKVGG